MSWFEKLFINEAKPATERHSGGGKEPVLEETTITSNGEHIPSEGVDGFNKVNVAVAAEGDSFAVFLKHRPYINGLFNGFTTLTDEDLGKMAAALSGVEPNRVDSMFYGCKLITTIPHLNTSNVTKMDSMFYGCNALSKIPQMDTSNVTDMYNMFHSCYLLSEIPQMDTSKVTNMESMFYSCRALSEIPELDMRNVIKAGSMFCGCRALSKIPQMDTSNVTNISSMFHNCKALSEIPPLDTSNATSMGSMFYGCESLSEIPELDMRNVTSASSMFNSCAKLSVCLLKNIKVNLQVGSGTSYGHLLTVDSLIHLIYELRDTGSAKTLTVGTANLAKLTDVYVKTIEVTDAMRAEDDLVDEKLPFEVCESTDEGATLITDYVLYKNWEVK